MTEVCSEEQYSRLPLEPVLEVDIEDFCRPSDYLTADIPVSQPDCRRCASDVIACRGMLGGTRPVQRMHASNSMVSPNHKKMPNDKKMTVITIPAVGGSRGVPCGADRCDIGVPQPHPSQTHSSILLQKRSNSRSGAVFCQTAIALRDTFGLYIAQRPFQMRSTCIRNRSCRTSGDLHAVQPVAACSCMGVCRPRM